MKLLNIITIAILFAVFKVDAQQQNFDAFADKFVVGYQALNIPELQMGYVEGLQKIQPGDGIRKQVAFFTGIKSELVSFTIDGLTRSQQQDLLLISYETNLNLERLKLEEEWAKNKPLNVAATGIYSVPDGKQWYAYLLKKWLSANVTPDEIYQLGLKELANVKQHIKAINVETGLSEDAFYKHLNEPSFFTSNKRVIQHLFEQTRDTVNKNLDQLFYKHNIPELKIDKGASQMLAQAPGYYMDNTFFYNLFDKPYNKRQVSWLFLHEGIPGHHYQVSVDGALTKSKVQQLFYYMCFAEGWAAYTEDLGKELGVYKTPYDELGKWEWDIVRAVRIPMDVGLNYYGWTDEQALAFWKRNVTNQDDIALREIARVKRWPAQAITYNYGALQIEKWKSDLRKKVGKQFNIKDFHDRVLNGGSLPLSIVEWNLLHT